MINKNVIRIFGWCIVMFAVACIISGNSIRGLVNK